MIRLIVIFCLMLSCQWSNAQIQLSGTFESVPVSQVLAALENEYALVFSYTEGIIENQEITASFQDLPLKQALTLIFEQTTISFEQLDATYIILRKRETTSIIQLLTLCGTISNQEGEPLAFATIYSTKTGKGTTAEEDGTFEWSDQVTVSDTIIISYIGYQSRKLPTAQLMDCPQIQLDFQTFSFSEVLVKEYITPGISQSSELDHHLLRPQQIDVVPGLTEADVLQMVQILPGVQSVDESAAGLYIRGGTPDQNLILWDGIPIYNSGHFFGMISAFNPYIVDEVKVYRSGFGAEYGGRIASVIDIQSENEIPERLIANAGINFTHADFSMNIPLLHQKSALVLSARRAYTDIIESPTYKKLSQRVFQRGKIEDVQQGIQVGEDIESNLNFVFNDLNAKWLWRPDSLNQFSLSAFGVYDQFRFSFEDFEEDFFARDRLSLRNIGGSARWARNWNHRLSSDLQLSITDLNNEFQLSSGVTDTLELRDVTVQINQVRDVSLQWNQDWRWSENLRLKWGYQFSNLEVERSWIFDEDNREDVADNNRFHTTYLTLIPSWRNKIRLNMGGRWSYSTELKKVFFEPRFSLNLIPNRQWQFKVGVGDYRQFMNQLIEFNDLGLNQQLWALADAEEDLPISRAIHYSGGISYHTSDFQFEVETYYKRLTELTSISPIFIELNQSEVYSIGTGRAWGIDLLLKKRWNRYHNWLSYSYSRVKYIFDDLNDFGFFPAPHDRPHALTSVHQLKLSKWQFSMSWKYASGKVYTFVDDIIIVDDENVIPDYSNEPLNENRLSAYHRLDFSVLYRLGNKEKNWKGMLGLSFLNVYNRRNLLSRQYIPFFDDENEEFVLEALDRPMLRFTPNVVFRVEWQ